MIDKEIALVRAARPADLPDDAAVKARAWARLQAEMASPGGRASASRPLHRRIGWRLGAVGVIAAGAAAAVVVTQAGGSAPSGKPNVGPAPSLELAARTIEHQTVPRPRANQWVYAPELRNWAMAPGNEIGTLRGKVKVEQWWRFDGRRIAESINGSKVTIQGVLRPGEKLRPGHAVSGVDGGWVSGPAIWRSSPRWMYDYVAKLPTDPDALLAKIRHDVKDRGNDSSTFGRIQQILDDDKLIPPKTNAALYRALAKISGVRIVPGVKDFAGRTGVAVVRDESTVRVEIILDPKTYQYRGWRSIALKDQYAKKTLIARAGKVLNDTADEDARVVDQPGVRG
ncbi:CU044_5270 family protein [Actinoallomurus sp. NBC_01490]|uniref:CU044_5270 family protein n=1 Tax=Actinoallomurus sp. NBC_01490 TaxID=2903557 RepID=UPI002E2F8FA4|nr:CU044_5270 family protein [Actinoallomurus sp. NBC_01490]